MVFDLDGVLVDSESLAFDAWRAVLKPYGIEVTAEDVAAITGRTFVDSYAHFEPQGLPDPAQVGALLDAQIEHRLQRSLLPFEDAFDAVEVLHDRGVPLAIATSSSRARLDVSIDTAGLAGLFGATAAGDEVELGKPAPDVYLLAAARLGVDPATCVAVEDTQIGVEAAQAAGMYVVAVQRTHARLEADVVVPRLIPAAVLQEH